MTGIDAISRDVFQSQVHGVANETAFKMIDANVVCRMQRLVIYGCKSRAVAPVSAVCRQ